MGRSTEFTGSSFEEALEKAVRAFQVPRESLKVEVVSQKKTGILRWRKQVIVIRAEPEEDREETVKVEGKAIDNKRGKAWIRDGGVFFETDSDSSPVIVPVQGANLFLNGDRVHKEKIMSAGEDWKVEGITETAKTEWNIVIHADKLQAKVYIKPGFIIQRSILDMPPAEKLVPQVKEEKQIQNDLDIQDLEKALADKNICYGIDWEQVKEACETGEEQSFIIAKGDPPVNGRHGTVAFELEISTKRTAPKILEDGNADFRESTYIPTVAADDVFAYVKPPEKGISGKDIFGETVQAIDGKPADVQAGKGVKYNEEKNEITASQSGRPHAEYQGNVVRLSIIPKLEHSGNVNLASGNLQFAGDIVVSGNVEEQMKVEAEGELMIEGHVTNATVKSGNLMQIHQNVINSKVSAGYPSFSSQEIQEQASLVSNELSQLIQALEQLQGVSTNHKGTAGLHTFLNLLLNKKFPSFLSKVKTFIATVEKDRDLVQEEWTLLARQLYQTFVILHKDGLQNIAELQDLQMRIIVLLNDQSRKTSEADVTFSYAMNSEIFSAKDVYVVGKGCSHTKIHAEGKVKVERTFVGGEIYGGNGVIIGEAGSRAGAETWIEVPEGETIRIDKAMEDTILKIGNRRFECSAPMQRIYARVNRHGELSIR